MSQLNSILTYITGRIHFIGGIHGVGKSSLCRDICNTTALLYVSESELLKWREITPDPSDKKVADISMTQSRFNGSYLTRLRGQVATMLWITTGDFSHRAEG